MFAGGNINVTWVVTAGYLLYWGLCSAWPSCGSEMIILMCGVTERENKRQ